MTRVRHDLRSLVQSVVGYADLLSEARYGALSPDQTRFVGNVREAAEHLQELVDTCIELSRPANDQLQALEPPLVQIGQTLRRVRNGLLQREMCCDLTIAPELETRCLSLEVQPVLRALTGMAEVITREGSVTLQLRAALSGTQMVMTLSSSDAQDATWTTLEALEDQLGNRDFVRLKLGEVLLSRQGFQLRVTPSVDCVELIFDL